MLIKSGEGAEEPVAVSTNEVSVPLGALPFLPESAVSHIDNLSFASKDGVSTYHRKTKSVDIQSKRSLVLKTFDDDTIKWSVDDGPFISITLKDGSSWTKNIGCVACTAANVYSTPAIVVGMEEFMTTTQIRKLGEVGAQRDLIFGNSLNGGDGTMQSFVDGLCVSSTGIQGLGITT